MLWSAGNLLYQTQEYGYTKVSASLVKVITRAKILFKVFGFPFMKVMDTLI